ncbi:MAG: RsmE family RNA methyltransferase [Tepidisphaeraceae bacterium]
MPRRIHTSIVKVGDITLSEREAHHARDVLRLRAGEAVEVFDDAGAVAPATIVSCDERGVVVRVDELAATDPSTTAISLTVASAVPKGDRAEWMIEKLGELGVDRFIPLATARSIVLPEGKNKRQRWTRIATEAAKQSRRRGVMRIDELTKLDTALREATSAGACWHLSTSTGATPVLELVTKDTPATLTTFIGPEGGWTNAERAQFTSADTHGVRLTPTILRVETAAVAIAAIVGSAPSLPLSGTPGRG